MPDCKASPTCGHAHGPDHDAPSSRGQEELNTGAPAPASFLELFDLDEIQSLQDDFARITGVASLITSPAGVALTRPSNSCRFCEDALLSGEPDRRHCMKAEAEHCARHREGPVIQQCKSCGLWDAGAGIFTGERHLANWCIGQVRIVDQGDGGLATSACQTSADRAVCEVALAKVPTMTMADFRRVADVLFLFANQLSRLAHKNHEMQRDMELRRRLETRLKHVALHDALSGLPNRALCMDRIRQAQQRRQRAQGYRFSVLFIDMDRFKVVNDSLGHAAGDFILRELGLRIKGAVRGMDTVSRIGGDEYVVILEDPVHEREAVRAAKRILGAIQRPIGIGGRQLHLNASIGIDLTPDPEAPAEDIVRNADMAMHYAKRKRPGYIKVFSRKFQDEEISRMDIETDLERAIRADEFFMVFQPIFEMSPRRRLYAFEALIRWRHPQKGLVSPDKFIPLAERTGSVVALGAIALEHSCRFLARLIQAQPKLRPTVVSVNVSPVQFEVGDIAADIIATLERHGLSGENLKVEITETTILKAGSAVFEKMNRLKAHGIKLSIDDFGVGYSNMSMLTQLPLDNLKIDLSLVRLIEQSKDNLNVVRAIIMMAKSLGLDIVAEGVETTEQLALLKAMGCRYFQGFLLSLPLEEHVVMDKAPELAG